jgi:hypothetical protein
MLIDTKNGDLSSMIQRIPIPINDIHASNVIKHMDDKVDIRIFTFGNEAGLQLTLNPFPLQRFRKKYNFDGRYTKVTKYFDYIK